MAKIGDICKGNEIGYVSNLRHIYHACESCGKERWVMIVNIKKAKNEPESNICYSCANQIKRGKNHPNWKGGSYLSKDGYIIITIQPDDPFYCMAYHVDHGVLKHRYIMAQHIGRPLLRWEIVHHKGTKYPMDSPQDRRDNRIENLELVTQSENLQIKRMSKEINHLMTRVKTLEARLTILEAEQAISNKIIVR